MADAAPGTAEVDALLRFYREIDSLNRGLDWRQELGPGAGDARRIEERDEVNTRKAQRIMHGGQHYTSVRELLDARVGIARVG